jgi:hypothetical protein
VKTPIDPHSEAPPVTFGVVATWLLAIAFGVAFWTLLFNVTPAIVGLLQRL